MTSYVWILLFGALLVITKAQELDLSHALDDFDEKPTPKPAPIPPKQGEGAPIPPKQGDGGFDLSDAVPDPNHPKPEATKKPVVPVQDGGDLSDSDLFDVGNDGYKPDPGRGGRSEGDISVVTDDRDDNTKELYQQWQKLLTFLGDNVPEGLHAWIANSKQVILSLLERLLEILDLADAEKQT